MESLTRFGAETNAATEWAWVTGRLAVLAVTAIGATLFLRGTPAFAFIMVILAFGVAYSVFLGLLLRAGRVQEAFLAGMLLDNGTMFAAWFYVARSLSGTGHPNDLYLLLMPILALGWPVWAGCLGGYTRPRGLVG